MSLRVYVQLQCKSHSPQLYSGAHSHGMSRPREFVHLYCTDKLSDHAPRVMMDAWVQKVHTSCQLTFAKSARASLLATETARSNSRGDIPPKGMNMATQHGGRKAILYSYYTKMQSPGDPVNRQRKMYRSKHPRHDRL